MSLPEFQIYHFLDFVTVTLELTAYKYFHHVSMHKEKQFNYQSSQVVSQIPIQGVAFKCKKVTRKGSIELVHCCLDLHFLLYQFL